MSAMLSNFMKVCLEIWKNIGVAQKTSIVLIALAALGAIGSVLYFSSRPEWQVLYSGLDKKQAAQVYEIVKDENVQCKLADSGRTLMVPAKDVYRLRLLVTNKGVDVEKNGEGWDIFDKQGLGTTQKQQQINEQRAIQGELERMIAEIPGISATKVMLAFPEQRVFRLKGQKPTPTASVMLVVSRGQTLAPNQIESVRYMVASAVRGMRPNDVTITDSTGKLLAKQIPEEEIAEGGDTSSQMEMKMKMEGLLQEKAEAILRPIVGVDNVVAVVSCDMVYDQIDTLTEAYDGDRAVPKTQKIVTNDMKKSDKPGSNARAGASSNVTVVDVENPEGGQAGGETDKTTSESQKTQETEFLIPKTVTKTLVRAPRVKTVSVAVSVAKKLGTDGKSVDWSESDMKSFSQLVEKAVGALPPGAAVEGGAGNDVVVKQMEFTRSPLTQPLLESTPVTDNILFNIEKYSSSPLVKPLIGLAMLFLLYRVFRSYFSKSYVEGSEIAFAGAEETRFGAPRATERPQGEMVPTSPIELIKLKSEKDPAAIAGAMENWLAQEKRG